MAIFIIDVAYTRCIRNTYTL